MMTICLCVILSLLVSFTSCQVCSGPTSPAYILTETELQQYQSCNSLNTSLVLGTGDCSQECNITSLTNLQSLTSITGDFIIQCCNQLTTISSLVQLTLVTGTVRVFNNAQLLNIAGFSGLRTAGNIDIYQNPFLVSITGLGSLGLANGYVSIGNNAKLTRIQGFRSLIRISGETLSNDHGLVIAYNPLLTDITGFSSIESIGIGSVRIEGNTNLCYAGYPVWSYGGYSNRYNTGDKGIDWRSVMESRWQFTWAGSNVPSLVIQNNGNETTCASATCSDACSPGVGCFGPEDSSYCGRCYTDDNINSCDAIDRPTDPGTLCPGWWPPTQEPFTTLFALVVAFGVVLILVLLVVLCLMGYKIRQCMKGDTQGNYSVSNKFPSSVESGYHSNKHMHSSPLKSNDRTVLGRGAGSSTSSSPNTYLYSVPNKNKSANKRHNHSGINEGDKTSTSTSNGEGKVRFTSNGANTSSPKQVHIPDIRQIAYENAEVPSSFNAAGNGQLSSSSPVTHSKPYNDASYSDIEFPSSFNAAGNGQRKPYNDVLYSDIVPSSFNAADSGQFKDPLKSSEAVLQSINQRPIPVAVPMVTTAEVHQQHQSPNTEGGEAWGDQLSDVGRGMRQQLRDGVWSEGYDSFDDLGPDEDEVIDGGHPQDEGEVTVDEYYSGIDQYSVSDIQLGAMMGKGSFGKVFEADLYTLQGGDETTHVVVKQSNDNANEEELQVFLYPACAMKNLKHDNVLPLLGLSMDGPNMYIILEYCSNGSLKTFLRNQNKTDEMRMKCEGAVHQILLDVVYGVSYFHSMGIAHNDLAARNCLVTNNLRVKVGDYGLSRSEFRGDYYSRTPGQMTWPIRWMSPEILIVKDGVLDSSPATETSNVWSYGILLWEVCSFGDLPYPKMTDEQVIDQLKASRPCTMANPVPDNDPLHSFYEIMKLCWQRQADRISMIEVLQSISKAKDEYIPVKYSNRPSRPAPKKPSQRQTPNKQQATPSKPPLDSSKGGGGSVDSAPAVQNTVEQLKQKLGPLMGEKPHPAGSPHTGSPQVNDGKGLKEQPGKKKQKSTRKGRKSQRSKPPEEQKEEEKPQPKKRDSWADMDEGMFTPSSVSTPPVIKQDHTHSSPPVTMTTSNTTDTTNDGPGIKNTKQTTRSRLVKGKSKDEGSTPGEVPELTVPLPNEQNRNQSTVPPAPPPPPPLPSIVAKEPKRKVPVTGKPSPPIVAPKPKHQSHGVNTSSPLVTKAEQHQPSSPSVNKEKASTEKQLKTEKKKQKSLKKRQKESSKSDEQTVEAVEANLAPTKQQQPEETNKAPPTAPPPPPLRVSSLQDNEQGTDESPPPAAGSGKDKDTSTVKGETTTTPHKDNTNDKNKIPASDEPSKKPLKKQDTWADMDEDMFDNEETPTDPNESKKPLKKQDTWADINEDMFDTMQDNNEGVSPEEDEEGDNSLTPPSPPPIDDTVLRSERRNDHDDLQLHRLSTGSDISRSNPLAQMLGAGQKQDDDLPSVSGSDNELDVAVPWPTDEEPHPPPEEYRHDEDQLPRQPDDDDNGHLEKNKMPANDKDSAKKHLKKQDTWGDFDEDMFDTTQDGNKEIPSEDEEVVDNSLTPPSPPPLDDAVLRSDRRNDDDDDLQLHRLSTSSDISRSNLLAQLLAAGQKQDDDLPSVSGSDNELDVAVPWPTDEEPHPPPEEYGHDEDQLPRKPDDDDDNEKHSEDNNSWDEFDMEDHSVDKLVDPSVPAEVRRKESAQRRESFMLPPDSPENTPPIVRRPSYVSELERLKEEDLRVETSEEEGDEAPPPVPDSLPPDDNDDEIDEMTTKFNEEQVDQPAIVPDPPSTDPPAPVPELPLTVPDPAVPDPSPTIPDPPPDPAPLSYRGSKKPLSPAPPPPPSGGKQKKKGNAKPEKVMTPPTDPLPSSTADKVDDDSIKQLNEKDKVQPRQDTVDADDDEFLDMPVKLDFLPVQTTMEEPSMVAAETVTKKETAKERKQREKREKKETKRRRSTLKKQKGKSASQQNEFW